MRGWVDGDLVNLLVGEEQNAGVTCTSYLYVSTES